MSGITGRLELSPWTRRGKINAFASETCKPHTYVFSILYIYTDIIYVDALHRWIATLARGKHSLAGCCARDMRTNLRGRRNSRVYICMITFFEFRSHRYDTS
jgi:hypothetical protein